MMKCEALFLVLVSGSQEITHILNCGEFQVCCWNENEKLQERLYFSCEQK